MTHIYQLNFFGKGHIYPTVQIMGELLSRGIKVTSYGLGEHHDVIARSGAEVRSYASRPQQEKNAMQLAAYQTQWAIDLLPGILADIERDGPSAIITDSMLPLGWYAARICDLPLVVSTTHFVANETILNALGIADDQLLRGGDMGTFENDLVSFQQAASALQSQFEITPLRARDTFQIPGNLTLVTTSAALQPFSNLLNNTYKFIGPIIETRGSSSDFPFDQIDGVTTVYVSLGTMAHDLSVFKIFPAAFADKPFQVVISSGGQQVTLGNLPENVIHFQYVPQLELLSHVDVFVTHGGWNSVNEALYYGVPMVICPQGKDQFLNAEIIENLGVGKALKVLSAQGLQAAVDTVLGDERYRQRADKLGKTLKSAGGVARAADEILALLS